jgi:hypothetical protein
VTALVEEEKNISEGITPRNVARLRGLALGYPCMGKQNTDRPATLTEAARKSGVVILHLSREASTARHVPYDACYRSFNSVLESPAEYLQRIVEKDKERIGVP